MLSDKMVSYHYIVVCRDQLAWLASSITASLPMPAFVRRERFTKEAIKVWHPARFAIGAIESADAMEQLAVLVLNVPLENRALFVQLCERGTRAWLKSTRVDYSAHEYLSKFCRCCRWWCQSDEGSGPR